MHVKVLKSKLHLATITRCDLNYHGKPLKPTDLDAAIAEVEAEAGV